MNKYLKRVAPIIAIFFMTSTLSGCASGTKTASKDEAGVITLSWPTYRVGTDLGAAYEKGFITNFNKTHEGKIKIVSEEVPGQDNLINKLKTLASANELPDIIEAPYNMMDIAARGKKLVDLTPYLNADPTWKSGITKRSLDFNTRDGKIYGIPTTKQTMGYFYNKELYVKAGIKPAKTWDEFWSNCDKLKAIGVAPISMDTAETGWCSNLLFEAIIGTSGAEGNKFMNSIHPKDFNKPFIIDATKKLQASFQKYTTSDAVGGKYDNAANNFYNSKTAIIANGAWMMIDFKDATKSPAGFYNKVGAAAFPNGIYDEPTYGIMIGSHDKAHADAAIEVVKAWSKPAEEIKEMEQAGDIPESPKSIISVAYQKKNPLMSDILKMGNSAVKYRVVDFQIQWYPNVTDGMSNLLPDLAFNKITPEQFCKKLTELAIKNQN